MDEPKRFWAIPVNDGPGLEVYLASDYDALRAEREALRSRLAVLTVEAEAVLSSGLSSDPDTWIGLGAVYRRESHRRHAAEGGPPVNAKDVMALIEESLEKAQAKHAPMHGPHEGYAVILEELDELWEEIRAQVHDKAKMKKEALHVAAMAARFVLDLCREEVR